MHRATHLCLTGLCCLLLLSGCERREYLVQQHLLEFGTLIEITLISDDLARAEKLLAQIESQLRHQRGQWHAWEDSDLTRFNRQLQRHGSAPVPDSLVELLDLSRRYYDASDGLFNPALGQLVAAYGFHGSIADESRLESLRRDIPGMHDLQSGGGQATSHNPQLQIDLGGIAKGYAIGLVGDLLEHNGIHDYVINAGGDLLVNGKRFGRPWRIGIRNPFAPGAIASIELEGKHSLFTSGNYARRYRQGDNPRHHIIDPRSGLPARGQSSATILVQDPVLADVAATALMVDGLKQPGTLARQLNVDDFMVVSETREIMLSRSFADKIELHTRWPTIIID